MAEDYVSFIVLLAGLFVISGGILLRGDLVRRRPSTNTAFLALGSVLASFIGTTGRLDAADPPAASDQSRAHPRHATPSIFFIFLVSNIGGMLTPLGDPPLFLGYLQGVPFTWTFRLLAHWGLQVAVLLARLLRLGHAALRPREPIAALRRDRTADRAAPSSAARSTSSGSGSSCSPSRFLHAPLARGRHRGARPPLSLWRTPRARSVGPTASPPIRSSRSPCSSSESSSR